MLDYFLDLSEKIVLKFSVFTIEKNKFLVNVPFLCLFATIKKTSNNIEATYTSVKNVQQVQCLRSASCRMEADL